jgi:hypothetical protein
MAAILSPVAQRINASTAGMTHNPLTPSNPGAQQHAASAVEVADLVPTEFGGLTHLFGGGGVPLDQFRPVSTSLPETTAVAGRLGGLVPNRLRTGSGASGALPRPAATPLRTQAAATFNRVRSRLRRAV